MYKNLYIINKGVKYLIIYFFLNFIKLIVEKIKNKISTLAKHNAIILLTYLLEKLSLNQ